MSKVLEDALKHLDPEVVCAIDWLQTETKLDLTGLSLEAGLGATTLYKARRLGGGLSLDSFRKAVAAVGVKRSEALRQGEMMWERLWRLTPEEEVTELAEQLVRDRAKLEDKKPSASKELERDRLELALSRIDTLLKERRIGTR